MSSPSHQTKVLVVEDNFIASKTVEMVMGSKGCLVDCVATGKEAIGKLSDEYDLILLDLGLPDIDGFEVAKTIKASAGILSRARIVILTALNSEKNREVAKKLGIEQYISKPFTLDKCDLILNA